MKKKLYFLLFAAALLFFFNCTVSGEDAEMLFSLNIIYPNNQIEENAGYFYFNLAAGLKQELIAEVTNRADKSVDVHIETADCFTAPAGDLIYITDNTSPDLRYSDESFRLSDNIKLTAHVLKLKPFETKRYSFTVTVPEIAEGELVGAVRFFENKPADSGNELKLNIKRAFTIPIRIRLKNPESVVSSAVTIGNAEFRSEEGRIYVYIANNLPMINRTAVISYKAEDDKSNELFEGSLDLKKMAPKTGVMTPIVWQYSNTPAGTYILTFEPNGDKASAVTRTITLSENNAAGIDEKNKKSNNSSGIFLSFSAIIKTVVALALAFSIFTVTVIPRRRIIIRRKS